MDKIFAAFIIISFAFKAVECFHPGITLLAAPRRKVHMSYGNSVSDVLQNYFSTLKRRISAKATLENHEQIPYSPAAEIKVFDVETKDIIVVPATSVDWHTKVITDGLVGDKDFGTELEQTQEVLSMDFISNVVSAAKVRFQIGQVRYTSLVSILKTSDEGWKIVSDVVVRSDFSDIPSGALFTPGGSATYHGNGRLDEEDLNGIIRATQNYIDGNHGSDVTLMKSCMHSSTHLFSVDAVTGEISSRSCEEYFQMMATRAPSFAPEVIQYDRIFKVDKATDSSALVTLQLGLPHLDGRLFTDHLFMMKLKGQWTIVSKTWTLHKAPVVQL